MWKARKPTGWHLSHYLFSLTQTPNSNILHLRAGETKAVSSMAFHFLFFCTNKAFLSAFVSQTVAVKSHKCHEVHLSPINEGRLVEWLEGIPQREMLMSLTLMTESQWTLIVMVLLMCIIMYSCVYCFMVKYTVLHIIYYNLYIFFVLLNLYLRAVTNMIISI